MEHRGIAFSVVEMTFPRSWKWTVGKSRTVTVGVCASRLEAIRQAQTFIDPIMDWAAGAGEPCGWIARFAKPITPQTFQPPCTAACRRCLDSCVCRWESPVIVYGPMAIGPACIEFP